MDPVVWGPLAWNLMFDVARAVDAIRDVSTRKRVKADLSMFFESLRYTLPCLYCRQSYRAFCDGARFECKRDASALRWVWLLHNRVNLKLDKQQFSQCALARRATTWSMAASPQNVWDYLFLMALNYPETPQAKTYAEKRDGYTAFFLLLPSLLRHVPHLVAVGQALDGVVLPRERTALLHQQTLLNALYRRYRAWYEICPIAPLESLAELSARLEHIRDPCRPK